MSDLHELYRRNETQKIASERSFGIVFACVFVIVGLWPLWDSASVRWWSLAIAAGFAAASFLFPASLSPLNRLWARFGALLHRVVSPVVLGFIYVIAVVPTGLVMRIAGYDPMDRTFDPEAESYWIERDTGEGETQSMERQF